MSQFINAVTADKQMWICSLLWTHFNQWLILTLDKQPQTGHLRCLVEHFHFHLIHFYKQTHTHRVPHTISRFVFLWLVGQVKVSLDRPLPKPNSAFNNTSKSESKSGVTHFTCLNFPPGFKEIRWVDSSHTSTEEHTQSENGAITE